MNATMNVTKNNVGTRAAIAALCMAVAGGFAFAEQKASCDASLRVMTYNIRYSDGDRKSAERNWDVRKDALANLVARENPDVVGFQEVLPDQKKFLEARFPDYVFVGEFRNADRKSGEASPIAYRKDRFTVVNSGTFWLSETPDVPGSKSWEAMFPRICSWAVLIDKVSGKRFAFANAHTDHKSELAREKGMLLAISRMKEFGSDCPIVFTGDHNCLEYEKPALAVSEILKDAMYLSETQPEGAWRTANGWRWHENETTIAEAMKKPVKERNFTADGKRGNRIDYIYVSPETKVHSYRTIAEPRPGTHLYPSDHFPSVAAIEFGKRFAHASSAVPFSACVWRGETAYVKIPEALQDKASVLYGRCEGDGVSLTLLRFDEVKYDLSELKKNKKGKSFRKITGKGSVPDVCREWKPGDKAKPTMIKVSVKPDAKPQKKLFELGKTGEHADHFSLTVVDQLLPPAKDWKYFLDLWQHPWAVSRYFNVKPFSKEHYAKMEPIWRALAESGCKALTVTLLDLPWNHQCYDGYYSMIGRVKKADGSWTFDYTLFDEYVEFGRKCGLGPDIACYTMCPWKYRMTWKGEDGKEHSEKMLPGTPQFEEYWGPFLVDFASHLKEKGWFEDAYIAMDERGPDDVRKIADLIQLKAPGLKVAICGRTKPSAFNGIKIENFCQGLIHLRKDFLPELKPRREKGYKTTFYVCFSAAHPNTFMHSPADEGFWLGAYPVMIGFDGFLRWAANSWPKDPYEDASYRTEGLLIPGDTYLIYPGGELSSRLISLRAGVVAAEKMNILKSKGVLSERDIEKAAKPYGFRAAVYNKFDFTEFRRAVESLISE